MVYEAIKLISTDKQKVFDYIDKLAEMYKEVVFAPSYEYGDVRIQLVFQESHLQQKELFQEIVEKVKKQFPEEFYAAEDATIEECVVKQLLRLHRSVSFAESCTGGLLCGRLVNVSGVSEVLNESYITYANEAKSRLVGVLNETLRLHGAVSEETAMEMAFGVQKCANSFYGVSVTGIAGPDGGTKDKPVGLVYIGCCELELGAVRKIYLPNCDRTTVRNTTVTLALKFLFDVISRYQK